MTRTDPPLFSLPPIPHTQVSPDNSRCVVLQEDINVGHYSLRVVEGESALDPSSPDMGKQYELPCDKLTVAFWFSPDSTKVRVVCVCVLVVLR